MNIILFAPQGRSGSYFLQSLFDNHPEIIFFPIPIDYVKIFLNLDRSIKEIIDEFVKVNPSAFTNDIYAPPFYAKNKLEFVKKSIDTNKFKDNFLSIAPQKISSHKEFFELIHLAFAKTLGYEIDKIKYILAHIHTIFLSQNTMNVDFFMKNYPNFKFLIPTRDFKEMMYSSLAYTDKWFIYCSKFAKYKFIFFPRPIYYNLNSKIIYDICLKKPKEDTVFVDLARLHLLQDKAMERIAKFLDIKYLECLTKSTVFGNKWQGNTIDVKPQNGFDIKKATEKRAVNFAYKDLLLFRLICFNVAKTFGCELEPLNKIEKLYAWVYLTYLLVRPITAPLWYSEREELNNLTKDKIKDEFYKKLPLWLSKKLIFMKKKINRTKKFYKELNSISVWREVLQANDYFKDKFIEKERFL